jgi:flagellar L-ring protein precursor FlgH
LRLRAASSLAAAAICGGAGQAAAQSASIYGTPDSRAALMLPETSFTYQKIDPAKQIQLHDIITVIVNETSQVISEGEIQRRNRLGLDARLLDWLRFDGLAIKPAPQLDGDPRIRGQLNAQIQNQMELETRDGMKFRIAAEVVDIRPNGRLVIEGRRFIENNNEIWEQAISGEVNPNDVLPNNTVLSEKIYDIKITKREEGHVRDGYRRGWFLKAMDKYKPF